MKTAASLAWIVRVTFQFITAALLILLGLAAIAWTMSAALGHTAWLDLGLTFGDRAYPEAGMIVQIAVTTLIVGLLAYLPGNARVMALETSHRRFNMTMEDVTRAYRIAHAADRGGNFNLKSEFDSVRERIAYLRDHPDLAELEAPVIEVAAQMSHISRDLASVYSDDAVARARDFLIQRQNELEDFNQRLSGAKATATELRQWVDAVELDESVAKSQLTRLREDLMGILPEAFPPEVAQVSETESAADPIATGERDWLYAEDTGEEYDDDTAPGPEIIELISRKAAQ